MNTGSWLGLDIGTKRIGVALARVDVRMAQPHATLENNDEVFARIAKIIQDEAVQTVVAGLPRGLDGQDTEQTRYTKDFVQKLQAATGTNVMFQDEALTSQKAEAELSSRKKPFAKGDVDALAATYILEDYINEHVRGSYV